MGCSLVDLNWSGSLIMLDSEQWEIEGETCRAAIQIGNATKKGGGRTKQKR